MEHGFPEIDHVLAYIQQHLYDPLTLNDLAKQAAYSPYHFTRLFKKRIGVSPQYYVSVLRLQRAKELLLHTGLSVRDISLEVGQQSLGTFTTRFTERVGVTPAQFRNSPMLAEDHKYTLRHLNNWEQYEMKAGRPVSPHTIEGNVHADQPFEGVVFIGLFAKPIPERIPLYGTLLFNPGSFRFTNVRPGIYYIMATSMAWDMQAIDVLLPHNTLRTRSRTPVIVGGSEPVPFQHVQLYPPRIDDPPILISLPLLMNRFLQRVSN
ncbi:AraC family transcriptional regulator [Xylanibacillus composti]|uniref:AraC family transcriptional regulator n=1 Tax=Xylanibacillus composti TaxID=1572762 RepID=A0A8J4M242_9BACL|nr:helix-turn-helix transcriptional regulator [Xylanibacillus composti]MDT9724887.1 AraC family transcriptional regulator [Xylanibacillus composti]GIQ68121.1 AraC family transcriptional regulator [Xylanibacillus composti]